MVLSATTLTVPASALPGGTALIARRSARTGFMATTASVRASATLQRRYVIVSLVPAHAQCQVGRAASATLDAQSL